MRYDGTTQTWINLASIPREAAIGCAALTMTSNIYLIGGQVVSRSNPTGALIQGSAACASDSMLNTVLCYSIEDNEWKTAPHLPYKMIHMGATQVLYKYMYKT